MVLFIFPLFVPVQHNSVHFAHLFFFVIILVSKHDCHAYLDHCFLNISSFLSQNGVSSTTSSNLVSEIAKARQHIKSSLERVDGASGLGGAGGELLDRISSLEKDNSQLHGVIDGLQKLVISLEGRLNKLEGGKTPAAPAKSAPAPAKPGMHIFFFFILQILIFWFLFKHQQQLMMMTLTFLDPMKKMMKKLRRSRQIV